MNNLEENIKCKLLEEKEIDEIITKLANEINNDYKDLEPLFIGVLKGCLPFMSDLIKKIKLPCKLDYIRVKSYSGTKSTGNLEIIGNVPEVEGKDVIIVEDIIDTGKSLLEIKKLFLAKKAKSVKVVTFLDKHECRKFEMEADYVGKVIGNHFVVGYGFDLDDYYRNLPYVGIYNQK